MHTLAGFFVGLAACLLMAFQTAAAQNGLLRWDTGEEISPFPPEQALLLDLDLRFADLRGVDLQGLDLSGKDLSQAKLDDSRFGNCDFSGARLDKSSLKRTELRACDLTACSLREARLDGARLDGSVRFTKADFNGACYSATSVFPGWFNPESQGLIKCGGRSHEEMEAFQGLRIVGALPNPFNPDTTLRVHMEREGETRLAVYDIFGREIALLHDGFLKSGDADFHLQVDGLSSGTYLAVLEQNGQKDVSSILLLK